jgi:L-lactate dehydrogenase complex protein LldG
MEAKKVSARDDMLSRIRLGVGRAGRGDGLSTAPLRPLPAPRVTPDRDRLARFRRCAENSSSTVDEVERLADVTIAVARYLTFNALSRKVVAWNEMADLDWSGTGIEVDCRAADGKDLIGITGAFCALAETGTLMLLSGPHSAATTSLLPETHIAVLRAGRIVDGMEEAFALLKAEGGELPRAVNFISGPSRTGDIEQTIVLGAHGPYRVHIVIVRGE